MSLNPLIIVQNWSRDSDDNLWGANTSNAIGVFGASSGEYGGIRGIAYCASGCIGYVARFNELTTGSRQYYQFRINLSAGYKYAALEEVNYSKLWSTPTILQSRAFDMAYNSSMSMGLQVQVFNRSQDRLIGQVNGLNIIDWQGTTSLSSGKLGILVQLGLARFDSFTAVDGGDAYCTINDVKKLLQGMGIANIAAEGEILGLICRASEKINSDTGTVFGRVEKIVEERQDGQGSETILLNHRPIYELYRVQIYNYNNALVADLTNSSAFNDMIIESEVGALTRPPNNDIVVNVFSVGLHPIDQLEGYREYDYNQYFGVGRRNIWIDYAYGYMDIPQEIWDATRKLVGIELLTKLGSYNTAGASMVKLGDAVEDYRSGGTGSAPFSGTLDRWQKDIELAIAKYSTMGLGDI